MNNKEIIQNQNIRNMKEQIIHKYMKINHKHIISNNKEQVINHIYKLNNKIINKY